MTAPSTRLEKTLAMVMMAASLFTLWASLAHPILDGDIWFHMLYGREMLAQKTLILDHTQFSWTPSTNDTIYCAWIGQLLYYFLYTYLAEPGIIAFRYLTCTVPFLALAHIAWQRGVFFCIMPWLVASITVYMMAIVSLDKPELLSLVFMTVFVWNWYQIRQAGPRVLYHIYLFPLVMLLWVNSHGIFTFGCIFLLFVGIGETLNQVMYRPLALPIRVYKHLIAALLLAVVAIFCTPYGPWYIWNLIQVNLSSANKEYEIAVTAWRETFSYTHLWFRIFANSAVVLLLLVLFAALRKRKVDFVPVLVNLVFAYFFTKHTRLIYLWVPVFALTVTYYTAVLLPVAPKLRRMTMLFLTFLNVAAFAGFFYMLIYRTPSEDWPNLGWSEHYVIKEEVDFIETSYPHTRLGNLYDEGPYILWRRWPEQKVMIDARYFPFKYWFAEYLRFIGGREVHTFLKNYPFDLAVIPHSKRELNRWFARSRDWRPVFYSKAAVLYFQTRGQAATTLQRGTGVGVVNSFPIALNMLNSILLLRDWDGYGLLLNGMRQNFTQTKQREIIEGITRLKPAMLAYEQQDYLQAIEFFERANGLKAGYPRGLSAAALNQSMLDWRGARYSEAVRRAMRALFAHESIQTIYNLAIMGWQLEQMRQGGKTVNLDLDAKEQEILDKWREALQQLIDRPNVPPQFQPAQDNARKILAGDKQAQVFFLPQDWM